VLDQVTVQKLFEMRLSAMAGKVQTADAGSDFLSLSFEERFGLLIDTQWSRRQGNCLARLIKRAGLHFPQACIEDIERPDNGQTDDRTPLNLQLH
jgi:L-ribulose-5-phosphate 3-epimerase UlaE